MNNLMMFENKDLGLNVRTIKNEDGSIGVHVGDVAMALSMVKVDKKGGKEYTRPNMQGVKKHLKSFGINFSELSKDDYLPENAVYALAMKADNKRAINFQIWLATEVVPSIRKTGGYIATTNTMSDEDIMAKALQIANAKIEARNKEIKELKPRADYTDTILDSKSLFTVSQIAKDYGMGSKKFNDLLHSLKIQFKQGEQWLLYAKYQDKGYVFSSSFPVTHSNNKVEVKMTTKWTQKGRKFLYDFLKIQGIVPTIERRNEC